MSYIQEFDAELTKKLNSSEDTESIVSWISEEILESYRNGRMEGFVPDRTESTD